MYFMALATDYDGTVAQDGIVSPETAQALCTLKETGRRLILVTGRELPDLERVYPDLSVFDRVVAENGALLYTPATKVSRALGPEPPQAFVEALKERAIEPLSVGKVIVATWEPHETVVLDTIRDLGLDLQIIFNKGAVMVLPSGINKASGLDVALKDLGLSPHNVVAVGDAENDLAFMRAAGCAVAVANALPAVKEASDMATASPRGQGVAELVALLIADEARLMAASAGRHDLVLGADAAGTEVRLKAGDDALIAGTSGSGKSTLANSMLERMAEGGFQFCILDPEGDYAELADAVVFGDINSPVRVEAVLAALQDPGTNVVVNLLGIDHAERPGLFAKLYAGICALRESHARPHWLVVDEAHHMLPQQRDGNSPVLSGDHHPATIFVTVHPDALARKALEGLALVAGVGPSAADVLRAVAAPLGRRAPQVPDRAPDRGEAMAWFCASEEAPQVITIRPPKQNRKRHTRKYAEGALGEDKSFYFRGPRGELNLRAHNLMIFLQMADGVDEETFAYHLKTGDYSDWFRNSIKDQDLAGEAEDIETDTSLSPGEARGKLRKAVEGRYTAPA